MLASANWLVNFGGKSRFFVACGFKQPEFYPQYPITPYFLLQTNRIILRYHMEMTLFATNCFSYQHSSGSQEGLIHMKSIW